MKRIYYNTLTQTEFLNRIFKKHGNKYLTDRVKYVNNHTYVQLGCSIHQCYFRAKPIRVLSDPYVGCPKCLKELRPTYKLMKLDTLISKFKQIHGESYDYTLIKYSGMHTKIEIICLKCNEKFWQSPTAHLCKMGCPHCNISKGEQCIKTWLLQNNIKYIPQKQFDNCINSTNKRYKLPFDFYLPDYNTCIEFDGIIHFNECLNLKGCSNWVKDKERLKRIQLNDQIKTQYCIDYNITLLRIDYKNINNINHILEKFINNINKH